MSSSGTRSLLKPKSIKKMERKMELDTVFRERKDVLCCLQETPSGFTETFIQFNQFYVFSEKS